jgi:hypothetical protein
VLWRPSLYKDQTEKAAVVGIPIELVPQVVNDLEAFIAGNPSALI